jgi:hypothetical protein
MAVVAPQLSARVDSVSYGLIRVCHLTQQSSSATAIWRRAQVGTGSRVIAGFHCTKC